MEQIIKYVVLLIAIVIAALLINKAHPKEE